MNDYHDSVYNFMIETITELFPRVARTHTFTSKTRFVEDLDLDSLDAAEIATYLDEYFNMDFINEDNTEEIAAFRAAFRGTIEDMVQLLMKLIKEKYIQWE